MRIQRWPRRRRPKRPVSRSENNTGTSWCEPLEPRLLLSVVSLDAGSRSHTFHDADGDQVTVKLTGPGAADLTFDGEETTGRDLQRIDVTGGGKRTKIKIRVRKPKGGTSDGDTTLHSLEADALNTLQARGVVLRGGGVQVQQGLSRVRLQEVDDATIASPTDMKSFRIDGPVTDSLVLIGVSGLEDGNLADAEYDPATIRSVRIGGDVIDSIIAAGGDPGDDALFQEHDVLPGGGIKNLRIDGKVVGIASEHDNPGIYAAELGRVRVNGLRLDKGAVPQGFAVVGTAVIDPLPAAANELTTADIESIIENAVAAANKAGVNATISVVDREGNLLAVVRMLDPAFAPAETTVDIDAGGTGGLEEVDGIVSTSLIAATKAGTAAFLSTSSGNAFTTRTAGFIIQRHFPPGDVRRQDGGPLFGVQLSSLPTSDINRLPLGLSADPGGVPLYRDGELLGGIGVEVDGVYTVDPSGVGGKVTTEEGIALAGQIGYAPPRRIRADRVFVDGIRFDYANGKPPKIRSLGTIPDYGTLVVAGDLDELVAPTTSPASNFGLAVLPTPSGRDILGEVPDNALQDFFDAGTGDLEFIDGDFNGAEQVTADDVLLILGQAHQLNSRLRAQIRKDKPLISQVTVSVVDHNGNLLGAFRTPDAPVFGYDVSVQKARTAAFFSRVDAATELTALDIEVDVAALMGLDYTTVTGPFDQHVERAADFGVDLDGSVAVADRTGGFLSRPNLPDGINTSGPGPLAAQPPDEFSPFNTGLQTLLIGPQLVEFLTAFNGMAEGAALAAFADGSLNASLDGPGVVPLGVNAGGVNPGGGLPGMSLANGMQIFAGSVPLYKDGVLVGGVGVSGDGIEQDDFIAFTGATGFQEFGDVTRADDVLIKGGIRLPYVKIPRNPFAGT